MSIFTDSTNDAPMSSICDVGCEQSDMDTSSSEVSSDATPPKDYWFGRKYFECVLAQHILQGSRLHESVAQIDSQLEGAIQSFPYVQSLTELRSQGLEPLLPVLDTDPEHGAYRLMMFCIGAVVRNGDRKQKAALLSVLRQYKVKPDRPSSFWSPAGNAREGVSGRKHAHKMEQFVDDTNVTTLDLGRYATALKEYGDKHEFVPTYHVMEMCRVPPRFRAIVTVDGSVYVGTAKTKKQARHEAAREACLEMEIDA